MTNNKLIPVDNESLQSLDSMKEAVYDGLQKKCMKTLMFCIIETVDGPTSDEYTFSFSYSEDSDSQDVMINICRTDGGNFDSNAHTTSCKMVPTLLVQLMGTLDKTPDQHTVVIKLLYHDDVTPPPFFRGCIKEEAPEVGNVCRKHLVFTLKVKSVLDPCEDENDAMQDDGKRIEPVSGRKRKAEENAHDDDSHKLKAEENAHDDDSHKRKAEEDVDLISGDGDIVIHKVTRALGLVSDGQVFYHSPKAAQPREEAGIVTGIQKKVSLGDGDTTWVDEVDVEELNRIRPFFKGDWVSHDIWLGKVTSTELGVTIVFEDNSEELTVTNPDPEKYRPQFISDLDRKINTSFYKGQRVLVEKRRATMKNHWVHRLHIRWTDNIPPPRWLRRDCKPPPTCMTTDNVNLVVAMELQLREWTVGKRCVRAGRECLVSDLHYPTQVVVLWKSGEEEVVDSRHIGKVVKEDPKFFRGDYQIGNVVRLIEPPSQDSGSYFGVVRSVNLHNLDDIVVFFHDGSEKTATSLCIDCVIGYDDEGSLTSFVPRESNCGYDDGSCEAEEHERSVAEDDESCEAEEDESYEAEEDESYEAEEDEGSDHGGTCGRG